MTKTMTLPEKAEVVNTGEHPVRPELREALAAAFGERKPSDPRAAKKSFDNGILLVKELRSEGQISPDVADKLTYHLATLYLTVLISEFSGKLGVSRRQSSWPHFLWWLSEHHK